MMEEPVEFIGPPIGWFGKSDRLSLIHPSMMNRMVIRQDYPDGFTHIYAIGPRFLTKE
jgi:hypothetical protein